MPDAPPRYTEVYLYGLLLCSRQNENSLQNLCAALNLTPTDVKTAFTYWEELGLVSIIGSDDFKVVYMPIKTTVSLLKKIKPGKYFEFNKKMQNILVERMIPVNEYNEYYVFLETTNFEPEALVEVAEYCAKQKGKDISYQYILTVARNLATHGIKSATLVKETLKSRSDYSIDVKMILKSMGSRRQIEAADEQLYEKWTKDFGFAFDVIIVVAKTVKYGGMKTLDSLMCEYYKQKLFSVKEIENYTKTKDHLYTLAKQINATIGVYYQTLDMVVTEYIHPWLTKGYDDDTLIAIAKYCFKSGIRTLEGMNTALNRFYKMGIITQAAIDQYIIEIVHTDEHIREILSAAGILRRVTNQDRANFKIWTTEWHLSEEIINYAAQISKGTLNPTAYMCKVLTDYKERGVKTVEQAEKSIDTKSAASVSFDYKQRDYTDEQLRTLFDNLDDIEV
ncbi:MAG TPA: DnaD domain protein [Clostridia bacterium]|nr:DnaD domain protein [Clostridia bacterium]